jgi:D-lactate dehydrogenase (cytochrome)
MLFCEFHGSPAGVEEQARTVQEIARELGGTGFRVGDAAGRAHKAVAGAPRRLPGVPAAAPREPRDPTDVCVPISRLAECIAATNEDIARATMPIALFGHVGDGNFHLVILIDPENR